MSVSYVKSQKYLVVATMHGSNTQMSQMKITRIICLSRKYLIKEKRNGGFAQSK